MSLIIGYYGPEDTSLFTVDSSKVESYYSRGGKLYIVHSNKSIGEGGKIPLYEDIRVGNLSKVARYALRDLLIGLAQGSPLISVKKLVEDRVERIRVLDQVIEQTQEKVKEYSNPSTKGEETALNSYKKELLKFQDFRTKEDIVFPD